MKIFYFTSTGNSLYIAKSIGGELYSIPKMLKEEKFDFSDEKIGVVFPVYGWSVPALVAEFLNKAKFNCNYLFAVMTYGFYIGGVAAHLSKIGKEAGLNFSYINKIKMVDNFLSGFEMGKQIKNEHKKQIEKHLEKIRSDINNSKNLKLSSSLIGELGTKFVIKQGTKASGKGTFMGLMGVARGKGIKNFIRVEDSCTQCGICARACPTDNIKMDNDNGKITLGEHCVACHGCIHSCPVYALHLKSEKSSARFRNQHVTLEEILKANG